MTMRPLAPTVIALAGAVGCGLAVTAVALTATASGAGTTDAGQTFQFRAFNVTLEYIDVGDEGQRVGDHFVFSDEVVSQQRTVGTVDGECAITRTPTRASWSVQCLTNATLRQGQLTFQGVLTMRPGSSETFTVAVVGGTGAYAGAAGEASVRFLPDNSTVYEVHLRG